MAESNLDRMRKAAGNKPAPKPPQGGTGTPKVVPPQGGSGTAPPQGKPPQIIPPRGGSVMSSPQGKPKRDKPVKTPILVESVQYACGHVIPSAGWKKHNCPACAKANRIKRFATWNGKIKKSFLEMGGDEPGRMPEGTWKTIVWADGVWTGKIVVPPAFEATATGDNERLCLHNLHLKWIEFLKSSNSPLPAPAPEG